MAPIDKCPYCGQNKSYYYKEQVSGSVRCYENFDGSEAENSEMYEFLTHKRSKYAYCSECHKRIFKSKDVEIDAYNEEKAWEVLGYVTGISDLEKN